MTNKSLILKPKQRLYTVYGIQNTVTGRWYVGKTYKKLKTRKREHLYLLKQGIHHSLKLQRSFNKYGEDAFRWYIRETNISEEDINRHEILWIMERHNSYKDGYNMTEGGDGVTYAGWFDKPCMWDEIEYPSINEAARQLGISHSTMQERLAKGYKSDSDLSPAERKCCFWDGIEYASIAAAAKALGIHRITMRERFRKGYTCDDDINRKCDKKPVSWNGIGYSSIGSAAKALGINSVTMIQRLRKGYTCDEDMVGSGGQSKSFTWNGQTYESIKDASRLLGIGRNTLARYIELGYICDADIPKKQVHNSKFCIWNNIEYESVSKAAKALGIATKTLHYRLAKGYTCDDDLKNNKRIP